MSDGTGDASVALNDTINNLLTGAGGVDEVFAGGPTYVGPGTTTQQGWDDALAAANNPTYDAGVSSGIGYTTAVNNNQGYTSTQANDQYGVIGLQDTYGQLAANAMNDEANGLDQVYSDVTNDTLQAVNSSFNNSGLFGSDSNQEAASQGLASALGQLQLDQYNQNVQNEKDYLAAQAATYGQSYDMGQQAYNNVANGATSLGAYFGLGQAPSTVETGVGAAQDTAAQAESDQYISLLSDLFGLTSGTSNTGETAASWTDYLLPLLGIGVSAL